MDLQELLDLARKAEAEGRTADRDRLMDMYFEEEQSAKPSIAEDVIKSGASGGLSGFAKTVDMLGQGATLIQEGPSMLSRMLFGGMEDAPEMNLNPQILPLASRATGGFTEYEPQRTAGEYAKTMGEFLGGAMAMPYGGPLSAARSVVLPALASETAGQMTKGTEMEGPARLAAALGTPFATSAIRQGTQRAVLGPDARLTQPGTARGEAVQTLEDANVSMTTGLKSGSPRLMALEGSVEVPLETKRTLTTATMRTMGSDSTLATPAAMRDVKDRLGKVFDRADNVINDVPSTETAVRANKVIEDHLGTSATGDVPPFLMDVNDEILNAAAAGKPISNKKIQNMRSRLRKVMNGTDDPLVYESAFLMNGVVDDFMIESVRRTQPKLVPELMEARDQYRSYLTAMRALKTRGSDSAGGYISPAMLAGALRNREGNQYILGTGSKLASLGRAAEEVVSSMPAVQAGGRRTMTGGGGLLGAGGGAYASAQTGMDPMLAVPLGMAAGAAIPAAGRKAIQSRPMQSLLMPTQNSAATQMLLDTLRSGARQTGGLLSIPQ